MSSETDNFRKLIHNAFREFQTSQGSTDRETLASLAEMQMRLLIEADVPDVLLLVEVVDRRHRHVVPSVRVVFIALIAQALRMLWMLMVFHHQKKKRPALLRRRGLPAI